jgi:hypothetical protein
MADIVVDGNVQVWFVTTLASTTAPTVAEITAGTKLGPVLRADGVENFDPTGERVDTTSIESTFSTSVPGRTSFGDTALVLKKQDGTDTVYTALGTPNTNGYIVMRFGVAAGTAPAASQKVDVYPVQLGTAGKIIEQGQVVRYRVPLTVTAVPSYEATVAA